MEQQPPARTLLAPPVQRHHTAAVDERPRKKRRWIWPILLILFAAGFYWVWKQKPNVSQEQAQGGRGGRRGGTVTINTATAGMGQMAVKLDAIGTVTPTYTASILSQANGPITAVHYHEGQYVRKGDPLIDIDPRPYQATLDTDLGTLDRDRGTLEQAKMDLDRYRAAWARNAIAKQTLDDQEKLVQQDEGLVKADEGTVESAKVQLSYAHITSPIDGRVGLRLVDPGNVIAANGTSPLVVVTQVQPITVVFTVPEDSLPQVQRAMRTHQLETSVFDRTDENQLGVSRQQTLDNQIDTTTGTVKVRASFPNRNNALFPNQFVNTKLLTDVLQNQVMIPTSAVQMNGQQAFVYLIQDNKAKIVNVKQGQVDGSMSAVSGIHAGDVVANSSFERLQNGSPVRIVKQKIGTADSETNETP